jgi:hypothetical protein
MDKTVALFSLSRSCSQYKFAFAAVTVVVSGNSFVGGTAGRAGAGFLVFGAVFSNLTVAVSNCIFSGNTGGLFGGGMSIYGYSWSNCSASIQNCVFNGNMAVGNVTTPSTGTSGGTFLLCLFLVSL